MLQHAADTESQKEDNSTSFPSVVLTCDLARAASGARQDA